MIQQLVPVVSNREVMPGVFLMLIESPDLASQSRPGQFAMITCDSGQSRLLRRPISIHRVNSPAVAFLFAAVGPGTEWLARRQAGEKIDLLGPLGNCFDLGPAPSNLLLTGGGIGVAPLCFLAQEALHKGHRVCLLIGARTASQVIPNSLIPPGCEVAVATEDGSAGEKGLITALLPRYINKAGRAYICGPLPMYQAIMKDRRAFLGDLPAEVSLEVRMGCGLGFCYACTIKTTQGLKQVCKDGPVFDLDRIAWDEL